MVSCFGVIECCIGVCDYVFGCVVIFIVVDVKWCCGGCKIVLVCIVWYVCVFKFVFDWDYEIVGWGNFDVW